MKKKAKYEELDEEYNLAKDNNKQYQQLIANMQENMNHYEEIIVKIRNSRGVNYFTFILENSELRLKITELMSFNSQLTNTNSEVKLNNLNLINSNTQLSNKNSDLILTNTNLMSCNTQFAKDNSNLTNENHILAQSEVAGMTICPDFCLYGDCQAESAFETEYLKKIPDGNVNDSILHLKNIKNGHAIFALDASGNINIFIYGIIYIFIYIEIMSGVAWGNQIEAYELLLGGFRLGGWNTVTTFVYSNDANILFTNITPEEALEHSVPYLSGRSNFTAAMTKINEILATADQTRPHFILFLSHGNANYPSVQIARMNELKANFLKFYFFAVGIMQEGILKSMADGVDGGKFIFVQNSVDLLKAIINIEFD